MTYDEYEHAQLRDAAANIEAARKALNQLRKVAPHWRAPSIEYPSPEAIVDSDLTEVTSVFNILPLAGDDAVEALRREARRLRPAATDGKVKGSGGRDAAIWLTALAWGEQHDEQVYLVSADAKAFGAAGQLDPVLATEALERGVKIVLCPEVASLLGYFAQSISVDIDLDRALTSDVVISAVRDALSVASFLSAASVLNPTTGSAGAFSGGPWENITLINIGPAHAYEVSGEKWVSVSASWNFHREMMVLGTTESTAPVSWRVWATQEATVLMKIVDNTVQSVDVTGWQYPNLEQILPQPPSVSASH